MEKEKAIMSSIPKSLPELDEDLRYPSSDGLPMGETDWHIWALIQLREALEDFFAERPDIYVASDLFLYYEEGNPSACKAPDIMVVKGVAKRWRRTFRTWVENAVPSVIVEIASKETWEADLDDKRKLYERLGVLEYFVFDPENCYLDPCLRGFRRKGKRHVPLVAAADGGLLSKELGLRLLAEGPMVRLQDARTGQLVLTRPESKEEAQRQAALEKQSAEQEKQRAEREKQRAEQEQAEKERERQRAEQEKQRADVLQAELDRLRAAQSKPSGKKR
jgi:Uma2 family endonuclease